MTWRATNSGMFHLALCFFFRLIHVRRGAAHILPHHYSPCFPSVFFFRISLVYSSQKLLFPAITLVSRDLSGCPFASRAPPAQCPNCLSSCNCSSPHAFDLCPATTKLALLVHARHRLHPVTSLLARHIAERDLAYTLQHHVNWALARPSPTSTPFHILDVMNLDQRWSCAYICTSRRSRVKGLEGSSTPGSKDKNNNRKKTAFALIAVSCRGAFT